MPRRPRPPTARRSEHWLRVAVNEWTKQFDAQVRQALNLAASEEITWLSPVRADKYAEYFDDSFLDRLQITDPKMPLREFWPAGGPRWDGLARTSGGKVILVEAKAHIAEAIDFGSNAGAESTKLIEASLAAAKRAFRAREEANWNTPFYQYANRLAHLYYLRALAGVDAYLLFVCFANAPDVPVPASVEEWRGAVAAIECALGLGAHPYRGYIGHLALATPQIAG